MKKTLLFVAALLLAAGAMAQDIWLGAQKAGSNGLKEIALSKNGTVVKTHQHNYGHFDIPTIIEGENGKVYYLVNWIDVDGTSRSNWTDVYEHDGVSGQQVFNCPTQQGVILKNLFYDHKNGDVYACGKYEAYVGDSYYGYYGIITKNDQELYRFDYDGYKESLHGITVVDGQVITCGGKSFSEGEGGENLSDACVWVGDDWFACAGVHYSYAYDILMYNGKLYVCGGLLQNGKWVAALWRTDLTPEPNGWLKSLELVKTYEGTADTRFYHMYEDAGYLYMAYLTPGVRSGVMKLKLEISNPVLSESCSFSAPSVPSGDIVVNNHGVYVAANANSKYFKDGQAVTTPVQGVIRKIAVTNPMNAIVYDLPFTENFEYGTSHWDDWYVDDVDNDNGAYVSYWKRNHASNSGNTSVKHRFNSYNEQQGSLYSPILRIPQGLNTTLRFRTKIDYLNDIDRCELWILFNGDGGHVANGSYEEVKKWEVNPSEFENNVWKEVEIDLTPYAGLKINLDFFYEGFDACSWIIDDVEVFTTPTGVEDAQVINLALYPNPANDIIRIEGLESNTEVMIYNTLGELVKTVVVGADAEISISELSAGLYVVRCGETSLRFVKE